MTDPEDDPTATGSEETASPLPRPGPTVSRLGALASFAEIGAGLLREIEASMTERRFDAGEALMRQGEEGDCLMVVQSGEVEVSVASAGERHLLKRAGPGEVYGEMALLTREPRTADVVARTPVRALVLSAEAFHRLARREPALAEVLSRLTAQRLGTETHDALSGKAFQGYAIRRRLGRGGMAVVYEASETASGRRVALKMMSHRLVFQEAARKRFQHEADLVESFDHENIARMFGRFEAFHTCFIVMEYCDGSSLDRILAARRRLPVPSVRKILGQVASALSYAHGRRVVHRDLKPSNVMVNRDGTVKLMDFGLAQPLRAERGDEGGKVSGTPPYMAPEQLLSNVTDVPSDLYGLGGLAFEMLTGRTLFRARDFEALRREHRAWNVPAGAFDLPGIGEDLRAVLSGCLVREPADRTANLDEIASWAGRLEYSELAAGEYPPPP